MGDDELPLADRRPAAWRNTAHIEFARRRRDMPNVVFSSTTSAVDWNSRLVTGDAVTEITRLKTEDGGHMDVGVATLAAAPCGPFFTALDYWVTLNLVETRTFPDGVLLTRYETRR